MNIYQHAVTILFIAIIFFIAAILKKGKSKNLEKIALSMVLFWLGVFCSIYYISNLASIIFNLLGTLT